MNQSLRRFYRYVLRHWKLQGAALLLGLLTIPLSLITPYLTKIIIDRAYGGRDLILFLILAGLGGTVFVLNGAINSLKSYFSQRVNHMVNFDITQELFRHLQYLSLGFFTTRSTGEHMYKITSDVRLVTSFICTTLPQLVLLLPRTLFILVIILYLNWKLALFALFLVPLTVIHPYVFGRWLRDARRSVLEKSQGIYRDLSETLTHMQLVKALGAEEHEIKRFEEDLLKKRSGELGSARLMSISSFSSTVLNKVLAGLISLYGGYQVIRGTMTLGSLTAVMIYLVQLIGLSKSLGTFYQSALVNALSSQRLCELFDRKPQVTDREGARDYHMRDGRIEYTNVTFSYTRNTPVLKSLSFSIAPASRIALVGPSGCGKTTLLSLLLRLYDIQEGVIAIDGMDTTAITLSSLKRQIGIALQEPFLWNDTIGNNVLYGREDATRQEMIRAATIAGIHEFVMNLPERYDTVIGEDGCRISKGQKQRIAIARALIRKPKILILDEALSSVDSESEDRVINAIKDEYHEATIIVASHRLSTVKNMDSVCFMEHTGAMRVGSHHELMASSGAYRELFASQLGSTAETEQLSEVL